MSEAAAAKSRYSGRRLSSGAAWLLVFLLFAAYVFSFIDRIILGLLVEPIKAEFALSDTQIGLLQGLAFALFYTICGLPIGWAVDRFARIPIAAAGVALWSGMTALCGFTQTFGQLFLARIGVGVGEATLSPAAYSLIADAFPREKLGKAFAVYNLGSSMGGGLAFILGGLVVSFAAQSDGLVLPGLGLIEGWRLTFLVVGIPGLLLAALMALFPEPRRAADPTNSPPPPIGATITFWRRAWRYFVPLHLAMAFVNAVLFGTVSWIAPYLIRAHDMALGSIGWLVGLTLIAGGLVGTLGGGAIGDAAAQRDGTFGRVRSAAWFVLPSVAGFAAIPFVSGSPVLLGLMLATAFAGLMAPLGNISAALQEQTPPRMRGVVAAFYLFVLNLLGITLGPLVIAATADTLFLDQPDGIGKAMALTLPPLILAAAGCFWLSAQAIATPAHIRRLKLHGAVA